MYIEFFRKKTQPTNPPKQKRNTLHRKCKKCRGLLRPRLRSWALAFLFCRRCPCVLGTKFPKAKMMVSFGFFFPYKQVRFVVVRVCFFVRFFMFKSLLNRVYHLYIYIYV